MFNLYWRVFESHDMSIDFACILEQKDCHIKMLVQRHRRAVPDTFAEKNTLSFAQTENSEALQGREAVRLIGKVWRPHIHQAIPSHGNQQLVAVHVAFGPVET